MLTHSGISVSVSSINNIVSSLSRNAHKELHKLCENLLFAIAYDNFDVAFDVSVPTVENGGHSLVHLTSGTAILLEHIDNAEHLRVSNYMWDWSRFNLDRTIPLEPRSKGFPSIYHALASLLPQETDKDGFSSSQQFQVWQFCHDLVYNGPEYFQQFKGELAQPPIIEQIPVKKMYQVPVKAMDINQSTIAGNIEAIENILGQANIGDPTEPRSNDVVDIRSTVVLVHGDLATNERVQGINSARAIEETPWWRFQYVVFVLGLFHLKMACANALWRVFIQPRASHDDLNGLLTQIGMI